MLRLIIVLSCLLNCTINATEYNKNHRISLGYTFANLDNKSHNTEGATSELNDASASHLSLSYHYAINEYFSAGLSLLGGTSTAFLFWDGDSDSRLDYNAYAISTNFYLPFSERSAFYLNLKGYNYDYDTYDKDEIIFNDDGTDFGYSLGWYAKIGDRAELRLGYEKLNLGKHIAINGINFKLGYHF